MPTTTTSQPTGKQFLGVVAVLLILVAVASAVVRVIGTLGWVTDVDQWIGTIITILAAAAGIFSLEAFNFLRSIGHGHTGSRSRSRSFCCSPGAWLLPSC